MTLRHSTTILLFTFALCAALALTGCSSADDGGEGGSGGDAAGTTGGGGTDATAPIPDGVVAGADGGLTFPDGAPFVPGEATTISAIQTEARGLSCDDDSFTLQEGISLAGVVVVTPRFEASANLHGYFLADPAGGPSSGIQLVVASAEQTNFQPGDILTLAGQSEEFFCMTQFRATEVRSTGRADVLPAPTDVPTGTLTSEAGEPFEGMLVRLRNVQVASGPSEHGEFTLDSGEIVDDTILRGEALALAPGMTLPELVGVVEFSFGSYKLNPRNANDIAGSGGPGPRPDVTVGADAPPQDAGPADDPGVVTDEGPHDAGPGPDAPVGDPTPMTIEAIQSGTNSTSCRSNSRDLMTENVVVEEAVVATAMFTEFTDDDPTRALKAFFVGDGDGGQHSGLFVTVTEASGISVAVGDRVRLVGDVDEFFCNTQLRARTVEVLGGDGAVAGPTDVTSDIFDDPAAGEPYEGVLVRIGGIAVTEVDAEHGVVTLDGRVEVDEQITGSLGLAVGDVLMSVQGYVRYAFGAHRMLPAVAGDVVKAGQ